MSNASTSSKLPVIARYAPGRRLFRLRSERVSALPAEPPEPASAGAFLGALFSTGYMFPLIKGTETLAGALLLSNRFVPLALTLLAPVLVNIVAFHVFLAPAALPLAARAPRTRALSGARQPRGLRADVESASGRRIPAP